MMPVKKKEHEDESLTKTSAGGCDKRKGLVRAYRGANIPGFGLG